MRAFLPTPKYWPIWALVLSAAMLAGAHAFEIFGRYLPCPLCLRQREVYWTAIAVAIGGLALARFWQADRARITANLMLCLVFFVGAVVASFHAGVEWNLWPGPADCSNGVGGPLPSSMGEIDFDRKFSTVSCSDAAWRLFGISMAGYNAVISLALAIISAVQAIGALEDAPRPVDS